jgi:hypothetical protein
MNPNSEVGPAEARSAGFQTGCVADFQVGGLECVGRAQPRLGVGVHALRVWKPATQQAWKPALRFV